MSAEATERTPLPCGTYGAYQRHRRAGEEPCVDCRKALREYHRKWRKKVGPERDRAYNAARSTALERLAKLHPAQFQILLNEERGR